MCSRLLSRTVAWQLWTLSFVLNGCGPRHDTGTPSGPPVVRVTEPVQRQVTDYEYFTGRPDAVDSVDFRARVTGYLTEVKFKPGQEVKEGAVLFVIDPRPYKAALDQAASQIVLQDPGSSWPPRTPSGPTTWLTAAVAPLVIGEGSGAEMRRSLGTAVVSRMLGVTFFGIFLTPVFYFTVIRYFERKPAVVGLAAAAPSQGGEGQVPVAAPSSAQDIRNGPQD